MEFWGRGGLWEGGRSAASFTLSSFERLGEGSRSGCVGGGEGNIEGARSGSALIIARIWRASSSFGLSSESSYSIRASAFASLCFLKIVFHSFGCAPAPDCHSSQKTLPFTRAIELSFFIWKGWAESTAYAPATSPFNSEWTFKSKHGIRIDSRCSTCSEGDSLENTHPTAPFRD